MQIICEPYHNRPNYRTPHPNVTTTTSPCSHDQLAKIQTTLLGKLAGLVITMNGRQFRIMGFLVGALAICLR
jgi:hypothetical protein